jgi:hypothetical protein
MERTTNFGRREVRTETHVSLLSDFIWYWNIWTDLVKLHGVEYREIPFIYCKFVTCGQTTSHTQKLYAHICNFSFFELLKKNGSFVLFFVTYTDTNGNTLFIFV